MLDTDATGQLTHVRRITTHTLTQNDWQLLSYADLGVDRATFVQNVLHTAQSWQHQDGVAALNELYLTRATQHEYSKLLYTACGRKDTPAGNRAYTELWNRYSRMVRFKTNDHPDAEDVTQIGMQKIYEKLAQCREPGHFLKWAYTIMLNEMRQYWRQQGRQPDTIPLGPASLEPDDPAGGLTEERLNPAQMAVLQTMLGLLNPSAEEEATQYELDQSVRELIRRCVQHETRRIVLQSLVLNGAEVSHLAGVLGRSTNAICVLKHRALKDLRRCPELLATLKVHIASQTGGVV